MHLTQDMHDLTLGFPNSFAITGHPAPCRPSSVLSDADCVPGTAAQAGTVARMLGKNALMLGKNARMLGTHARQKQDVGRMRGS